MESKKCIKTITGHENIITSVKFLPSGDQLATSSWDKTIKVWESKTGFCLKTFAGHEGKIYDFDINDGGTRMISCSNTQEIIYWDLDIKGDKTILNILEEEHENIIETVVFVPLLSAKTITKARMDQDDEEEEQTGGNVEQEEDKEEEKTDDKQVSSETKVPSAAEKLRLARERLARAKNKAAGKKV